MTKEQIENKINQYFPTGIPNNISATKLREVLIDMLTQYSILTENILADVFLAKIGGEVTGNVTINNETENGIAISANGTYAGEFNGSKVGVSGSSENGIGGAFSSANIGVKSKSPKGTAFQAEGQVAIQIISGRVVVPSGDYGKDGEFLIHSATTGQTKKMVFENGILIDTEQRA